MLSYLEIKQKWQNPMKLYFNARNTHYILVKLLLASSMLVLGLSHHKAICIMVIFGLHYAYAYLPHNSQLRVTEEEKRQNPYFALLKVLFL